MDTRERAKKISDDVEQVLKGMDENFSFAFRENMIIKALTYIMADREEVLESHIKKLETRLEKHGHNGQSGKMMDHK